jgi:protein SCO1
MTRVCSLALLLFFTLAGNAYDTKVNVTGHELPAELGSVGITEKQGQFIDKTLVFKDEQGRERPIGEFFHRRKPVLLAMVYYNCPSLCNFHLNGLTETMKALKWSTGREFELIAVSMDHNEGPELALAKKHNYLKLYDRANSELGWHFLTGSEANVKALADQIGFKFKWLPEKKQFAHAAVTHVLTPDGKISRYLHGIQPEVATLRMSLLEASNGKIGSIVDQMMMFCFQFNPEKNKYTLYAWNIMRLGAVMTVLLLALFLVPVWWREQRR